MFSNDTAVVEVAPETTPVAETPKAEEKAKKVKSTTTVKKGKKPAKKPAAKKAAKVEKKADAPKTGLRKMQLRALRVLADDRNAEGLSLEALAKKAGIGEVVMRRGLGAADPDKRAGHDESVGFKSLLTIGHVRAQKREFDNGKHGDTVYVISASGRAAMGKKDTAAAIDNLGKPHAKPYSKRTPAEVEREKAKAAKKSSKK